MAALSAGWAAFPLRRRRRKCCPPTTPGAIKFCSLDQAEPTVKLLEADSSATFVSGHLLFARDETMMAQPFDLDTRTLSGEAVPVVDSVSREGSRYVSASVSGEWTLVYAGGGSPNPPQLIWFNRAGATLGTLGSGAADIFPALSPDEGRVAVALRSGSPPNLDIWTIDIARGLRDRVTTDPPPQGWPVWSPDGTRIVFGVGPGPSSGANRRNRDSFRLKSTRPWRTKRCSKPRPRRRVPVRPYNVGCCRAIGPRTDVRAVTIGGAFPRTSDIWALPMVGSETVSVIQTQFRESLGVFSPDGRWIAYMTDETGELNVYVQPFLRQGGESDLAKRRPQSALARRWEELFYLDASGAMTAVTVDTTKTFAAGLPKTLFPTGGISLNGMYAVTRDGQRFLVNTRPPNAAATATPLTVIVNWTSTLKK